MSDRFKKRWVGATLRPLVVNVVKKDGTPYDLTGDTALFTLQSTKAGSTPVFVNRPHTNIPGATGQFICELTDADVVAGDEYTVKFDPTIAGKKDPAGYGLRIQEIF